MKKGIFTLIAAAAMFVGGSANAQQQDTLLASIIKTISPVEVSDMIKKQGIKYDNTILNKSTNVPNYTNAFKQALNLGVFSTDLGYATINDNSMDALSYLTAVKKLAESLKVQQFINTGKIMGLAANKNDLNKLLDETSSTFENISDYLEKQKKSDQAALMLVGGWIETLYITCTVAQKTPNADLSERIIGQRIILMQILDVLKPYKADTEIQKLNTQLTELNKMLDAFKVEVVKGEAKTVEKEVNGVTTLVTDGGTTSAEINLSAEEIGKILDKVSQIRKSFVQ